MNILILAGGTGSIALQTGLYERFDSKIDAINTKILCNAYDNGKSTGDVRKVMGGLILGPSDVRKNQTTRLKLENPNSPWNNFLDFRFTIESNKAKSFCLSQLENIKKNLDTSSGYSAILEVESAINAFFETPSAANIDYSDFSLANIIYAGFAKKNNNSLRAAARIMAKIMGIKDNVILNDDTSLFLGAISKSGIKVTDEGDIVSWGKVDDPFTDIFFVDANGNEKMPVLCNEAKFAIEQADLIILAPGTQWSSLIPTYASIGFKEAIEAAKAKIIMVMNRQPDKDSPGQTASDIVNLLVPKYFNTQKLNIVIDSGGHDQMVMLDAKAQSLVADFDISKHNTTRETFTHEPSHLVNAIFRLYFKDYLNSEHFMFDYDDTLVGRGNFQSKSSTLNKTLLTSLNKIVSTSICTGNSIKAVSLKTQWNTLYGTEIKDLKVYADGGANLYKYCASKTEHLDDDYKADFVECINSDCLLGTPQQIETIINLLLENGIPYAKIENRGNVMISIKPIDSEYRTVTLNLVRKLFENTLLTIRPAGRTTIEICKKELSKQDSVNHVLQSGVKSITYVGDEMLVGNDSVIPKMNDPRVKCLHVKDPAETSIFLSTLLSSKYYES